MTGRRSKTSRRTDRQNQLVLVVDDNEADLSSTALILERFSYQVLKAATVKQAFAAAAGLEPSLIAISLDLPGMEGFKLLRHIKTAPSLAHIPLIGLTREHCPDLKERCFDHQAIGYLCKPLDPEALFIAAQSALETNRRSCMRVNAVLPVRVYGGSHDCLYGAYTLKLSAGGMFLRTMNPVAVESTISVEFDVNGHAVSADSVVLYNCQSGPPCEEPGVGLRFTDISSGDRNLIRHFIRAEIMKNVPSDGQPDQLLS